MPWSQSTQISAIVGRIEQLAPRSILDVGAGMGVYGFLARHYLEQVHLFRVDGPRAEQRPRHEWRVRIDAVEGYPTYLTPVHDWAYDRILVGDALEILPTLGDGAYELVLAIDILEHLTTPDGERMLAELRRLAGRAALVSTPKRWLAQEVEANPYETHRSLWSRVELAARGFTEIIDNAESWIAVYAAARAGGRAC